MLLLMSLSDRARGGARVCCETDELHERALDRRRRLLRQAKQRRRRPARRRRSSGRSHHIEVTTAAGGCWNRTNPAGPDDRAASPSHASRGRLQIEWSGRSQQATGTLPRLAERGTRRAAGSRRSRRLGACLLSRSGLATERKLPEGTFGDRRSDLWMSRPSQPRRVLGPVVRTDPRASPLLGLPR
jgi:hypothetical protein